MPWIGRCIQKSNELLSLIDMSEPGILTRDLSKHLGVISHEKREAAINSYLEGVSNMEEAIYGTSPYHLKFGFSNSMSVLAYLVRMEPYTSIFIDQNGRLDHPDRMLSNVEVGWTRV